LAKVAGPIGRDGVDVEVREAFDPGELGFVDPSDPAPFAAVIDLSGQDLGEEPQVGMTFPHCDLGQPGRLGPDGG
jgi:hypothetical protein